MFEKLSIIHYCQILVNNLIAMLQNFVLNLALAGDPTSCCQIEIQNYPLFWSIYVIKHRPGNLDPTRPV